MMVAPSVTEAMVTAMPLQLEAMLKQLEAVMAMVAPSVTEAEMQAMPTAKELSAELEAELQAMPTAEELMAELEAELQTVVLLTTAHGGADGRAADG